MMIPHAFVLQVDSYINEIKYIRLCLNVYTYVTAEAILIEKSFSSVEDQYLICLIS